MLLPLRVLLQAQWVVEALDLPYSSCTLLFSLLLVLEHGLDYQLFFPHLVHLLTLAEGVVPLRAIRGEVVEQNAPNKRSQAFDIIRDAVERKGLEGLPVNNLRL